ncbi:hypothetical protein Poli38472_008565 [Pythium oligandrum]|uniref:Uncharacterized protein n=1 Tax=Pythium oligandrum TaxID=41045 RepID=A0A8K1C4D9_PYTOL|nr:hypothetical protein Poli38472_008565 [Pythium oligandrum]|eukprot:TMW55917.1 hypothetical protein Poli38472_008565 [Pythium oligandrum]
MNAKRKRHIGQSVVHPSSLQMGKVNSHGSSAATNTPRSNGEQRRSQHNDQETSKTLDGFMMLDCCHVEFPDELTQAVLSGQEIKHVVAEDLLFFTNLVRLDMSDNEAPFEPFACLPQLQELDFQCNALQTLSVDNGFQMLEVLNLSFNCLTAKDVEELSKLLRIRELYLSNNWIRSLPPVMDRFSKLEALSLEHNNIGGNEIFNFLAMAPRLRNLNLSHNKLTMFPETALTLEEKRGAGFYNLLYLNLAHNKITDEEDVIYTAELHSLRKLVLYGNPFTHAAVSSHDPSKLNYEPVTLLKAHIEQLEREIMVVVAYPETKKSRPGATSYENVEIYKMLPNEVPLPSPFRSRATSFLLPEESEKKMKPEAQTTPAPRVVRLAVDTSDSTFLTGVGLEDLMGDPSSTELPAVPASLLTRSLAVPKLTNPLKARAALNALRYQLGHPLTAHDDSDLVPTCSQRPTQSHLHRQLPRQLGAPDRLNSQDSSASWSRPAFTNYPAPYRPAQPTRAIDDALTQLSHSIAQKQRNSGAPQNVDHALDSLVSTAQRVNLTFNAR